MASSAIIGDILSNTLRNLGFAARTNMHPSSFGYQLTKEQFIPKLEAFAIENNILNCICKKDTILT